MPNIDAKTVASFGDEWTRMNQEHLDAKEKQAIFNDYFGIFPFQELPSDAIGFDMGCGSGRWATLVAPKVNQLYCIDASLEALSVSKVNLQHFSNIQYVNASVDQVSQYSKSFDFGYSLGVLHHIPDTASAIASCSMLLKPGAPFLLYLYFDFDNKPSWYRFIWKTSEVIRVAINQMSPSLKSIFSNILAAFVYWPLARLSKVLDYVNFNIDNIPLSYYKDKSFYTMRTDARDRFGTPLEQRFSKLQITAMLIEAGFNKIKFSEKRPYWVALGYKSDL